MIEKYGILTWYHSYNYGTVLQAFSLEKTINSLGFKAEIINYNQPDNFNIKRKANRRIECIKRIPPALVRRLFWSRYKRKIQLFETFFMQMINVSSLYSAKEDLIANIHDYCGFICGSDQIWTPTLKNFDTTYFLDFVPDSIKKIAYAPSIGCTYIPDEKKNIMKYLISRIDFLSIREKHGAQLIENLCAKTPEVVLDPTLLLNKMEWHNFSVAPNIQEPYILCYFLGNSKANRAFAKKLQKLTGYKLVVIPIVIADLFWGDIKKVDVGPKEFVGLIEGANYICTDSFHGTAFSINLEKTFFSLPRFENDDPENQNSRIYNVLKTFDLLSQYAENVSSYPIHHNISIDYSLVRLKLQYEREHSVAFLKASLR